MPSIWQTCEMAERLWMPPWLSNSLPLVSTVCCTTLYYLYFISNQIRPPENSCIHKHRQWN